MVHINSLGSAHKSRDCEGASVVKHPQSGGDRARDHKSGSVNRKKVRTSSLGSFFDAESNGGYKSTSSLISLRAYRD